MDLKVFNEQQIQAITSSLKPLLVIAGAGTGKTSVLTGRIIYLIKELKFDPNKILALTFTKKASIEMQERINANLNDGSSVQNIMTFHSLCFLILKHDLKKHDKQFESNLKIADRLDSMRMVRNLIKEGDSDYVSEKLASRYLDYFGYFKSLEEYSDALASQYLEKQAINGYIKHSHSKHIIKLFHTYNSFLKKNGYLDFDDILLYAKNLLETNFEVRNYWSNKFDYILIDEFQDTNYIQFQIIKLLTKDPNCVFAVGDPDQRIYSWRGAYEKIFDDFLKANPNCSIISLFLNYRSIQKVLDNANNLINAKKTQFSKNLVSKVHYSGSVNERHFYNSELESKFIISKIEDLKEKYDFKYNQFAILYRSHLSTTFLEKALINANIPYYINKGTTFFTRKEISDLTAYLKVINDPSDIAALERIINTPVRGIGEKTYAEIKKLFAHKTGADFFESFKELKDHHRKLYRNVYDFYALIKSIQEANHKTIYDLFYDLLKKTKYTSYLKELDQNTDREENVDLFVDIIIDFEKQNRKKTLNDFIEHIALFSDSSSSKLQKNCVQLMTIHAAKGLEFDNVFLVHLVDGFLPSESTIRKELIVDLDKAEIEVEEERRIFYVAITRAKRFLYITHSNCFVSSTGLTIPLFGRTYFEPSRFLEDLITEPVLIDNDKYTFSSSKSSKKGTIKVGQNIKFGKWGEGKIVKVQDQLIEVYFFNSNMTKSILKSNEQIEFVD